MKKLREYIFAVVFLKNKRTKFLILHRTRNWGGWEFLKGGLMENENELACLKREIFEETGARKYKISKTRLVIKYKWTRTYLKDGQKFQGAIGRFYIVQLFSKKIKIDRSEHDKFRWVEAKDAFKYLTYPNLKKALKYILKTHKL
jgi:8-oxo-dGTP pyrophosphatase MutT (NUDIX family)